MIYGAYPHILACIGVGIHRIMKSSLRSSYSHLPSTELGASEPRQFSCLFRQLRNPSGVHGIRRGVDEEEKRTVMSCCVRVSIFDGGFKGGKQAGDKKAKHHGDAISGSGTGTVPAHSPSPNPSVYIQLMIIEKR